MEAFDIQTKVINGTPCYTVCKKGATPRRAVLYLFGGGYILPPDPFFGTSSGGGQAMSLCVYIKHESIDVPLPGKLVLQSPGLQVHAGNMA